jgi:2-iminobutanoate/2-iminopropanoate deaminase
VKLAITTADAPQAIGPYSQAIKALGLVFVSGQIPIDPASGAVIAGGIAEQTDRVLRNIDAILGAAGSAADRVVKTTVYLADLGDFAAMNQVYAAYFSATPPARATIQVSRLPRDVRIEIDVIAIA